ncbi:MAG: hypothetical protein ABI649_01595 [Gaiellaceae bacterium]
MTRDGLGLLAANACFLAAGAGLSRPLGLWRSPHELPAVLAVAYVAGVAAVGIGATLLLLAGLALTVWQVLLLCALLAAAGFLPVSLGASLDAPLPSTRSVRRLAAAVAALLGIYLLGLLARSWYEPLFHWDAWAMWTLKARAIVLLDGLDLRVFAADAYRSLHLDYPLFVPALEAIDFRFMGRIDTRVVDAQFWFLFVGFLGAAAQLLRDRVQAVVLWPALLLLGIAPSLAIQLRWSIADFPLALFFGLAGLAGWRYLESGRAPFAALLALFGGAAWATKREGLAFVVLLYVVLLVFALVRRAPVVPLVLAGAASLVAILPWRIWVRAHDLEPAELPLGKAVNPSYLLDRTDRVGPALSGLAEQAFKPGWWLAVLPLFLVATALALRSRNGRPLGIFVLCLVGLMFASLLWAYWGDRPEIDQHVAHTARRVVTSALVVSGLFLPLLAAQLGRHEPQSRDLSKE